MITLGFTKEKINCRLKKKNMFDFIQSNWVSIIGAIAGLLYLYFEYKANIWMWAASIAMAAFYIFIFYSTQLYASMGIYCYFLLASIYGWIMWTTKYKKEKDTGNDVISCIPRRFIPFIITLVIIVFVIIYIILIRFASDQGLITVGDALTTSLNIVALWMISRKWVEQWLLLIPANAISACLLFIQHDIMSGFLFVIFFIVSIFGYQKWKRLVLNNNQ